MRNILRHVVAAALVVGLSGTDRVLASEDADYAGPVLDDEFFLVLGAFFSHVNSDVRVDSSSGIPGTGLDLEDDLGLASTATSPYLYFRWRYHPVHRIELEYYQLLRDEGWFFGSSTGLNVVASIRVAQQLGPGHTVVTMLCDDGSKYRSRLFNPDWLAERGLSIESRL